MKDWKGFKEKFEENSEEIQREQPRITDVETRKIDTASTGNIEIGNEAMENDEMETEK